MDRHTWAFIGVLVLIGTLAGIDLYLLDRIRGVDGALKELSTSLYLLKAEALASIEGRRKQLDKQESHIHREMSTFTLLISDAAVMLQEFVSQVREEASYDDPPPRGRYQAGGGGPGGGAPDQADLPNAHGEAGGDG